MAFLDETGLAELWKLIQAEDAKGLKVVTGTYTGTGKNGSSNKNSLTFDSVPRAIFISGYGDQTSQFGIIIPGLDYGFAGGQFYEGTYASDYHILNCSLSGKTITWYHNRSVVSQLNSTNTTYKYIAIV